jgi:hypothetical protein
MGYEVRVTRHELRALRGCTSASEKRRRQTRHAKERLLLSWLLGGLRLEATGAELMGIEDASVSKHSVLDRQTLAGNSPGLSFGNVRDADPAGPAR